MTLYGLLMGGIAAVLTAGCCFLLGTFASFALAHWLRSEWSAWLGVIAGYYGFFLGIPVGGFVCWKVCRSRLRSQPPGEGRVFSKFEAALQGAVTIVGIALLTSATCFVIGTAISLAGNLGWFRLGEYQAWLPVVGLEYGFLLGMILGVIARSRSQRLKLKERSSDEIS